MGRCQWFSVVSINYARRIGREARQSRPYVQVLQDLALPSALQWQVIGFRKGRSMMYRLAEWVDREVVGAEIVQRYDNLVRILNENAQPHQAKNHLKRYIWHCTQRGSTRPILVPLGDLYTAVSQARCRFGRGLTYYCSPC